MSPTLPTSFFSPSRLCVLCVLSQRQCVTIGLCCVFGGGDVFRAGFISSVCTCGCVVGTFFSTALLTYNHMDTRSVLWVHIQNIIQQNMSHCTNSRYCSLNWHQNWLLTHEFIRSNNSVTL